MTVQELIERLSWHPPEHVVCLRCPEFGPLSVDNVTISSERPDEVVALPDALPPEYVLLTSEM